MNKLNKAGADLIKSYEKLVLDAYQDSGGVWTIGYGHTSAAGKPYPKAGMKITEAEANAIFARDVVKFEQAVRKHVKVPLNDNQFSALVSLCFNIGEGNFSKSTLVRKLNAGDYDGAANEFKRWKYDNGKVLRGLVRRRVSEEVLFRSGKPVQSVPNKSNTGQSKTSGSFLGWLLGLLKAIVSGGQR